nr:hypothetical protein [Tanacetum cinerariifolium]
MINPPESCLYYTTLVRLPEGDNVVPLLSDTIRLVQNGCALNGLWSEDPNQHLKDFLKLADSLDLNGNHFASRCTKTSGQRLLELEDQINYLLKGLKTSSKTSSTQPPQAYAHVVSSNQRTQSFTKPQRKNSFTFQKCAYPKLQQRTLKPSFEARVQSYMVAHTERIERFEEAIYKYREEINERMTKMFSPLKEYTKKKSPKKVLVREEVSKPITKYVNVISLVRMENEKDRECDKVVDKNVIEQIKIEEKEKVVDDVEDSESDRSMNEKSTR